MSREKQKIKEITMWKYPYTAIDTIKNMRKYGIGTALSYDWRRTKDNMNSRLEETVEKVAFGLITCITIPVMMYQTCKYAWEINKRKKQSKKGVADEGFYPEVHENKNQIKRF